MRRLLLLMTTQTYRAAAFLEAAGRLDIPVTVGSEQPQALAAANPAGNLTLDFADPAAATQTVLEFARVHPIEAVVAADDEGAMLAAITSEALGLRHNPFAAVAAARDKHEMRRVLSRAGLPSPAYERVAIADDPLPAARRVGFPCVVKPFSLSASRGVIRADDEQQLLAAFRRVAAMLRKPDPAMPAPSAVRAGRARPQILIESYIPGVEIALEGLLSGGSLRVLALFDKPDPLEGPYFEETIYVTPSRFPEHVQQEIASATARACAALGLLEGPVHAELRLNEQGPWILEIAPRSIGGLCSRTLRFVERRPGGATPTAVPNEIGLTDNRLSRNPRYASLEELILRHSLGLETAHLVRERRAAGVMMIPIPRAGILGEVRNLEAARGVPRIEDIRITIPVWQPVVPLPEGSRYLGFIFARGETPEEVEAALREAHFRLELVILPEREFRGTARRHSPGPDDSQRLSSKESGGPGPEVGIARPRRGCE